jgi:hypothetical protein
MDLQTAKNGVTKYKKHLAELSSVPGWGTRRINVVLI